MRTNIIIDDNLMQQTLQATGIKTKKEAVEQGLKLLLQKSQQQQIRKLRGKLNWEGDLAEMRKTGVEA
ncbi:antitoxin VapB11 [Moraxella osloensis]|uniref:Antitoxin VapB11 n=1 Tax=Faucicola osloensis TaxID=34062 RepID=A0AA91FL86_FAUOS|nr:type II toxin-antitoxin system VapB family antitoxin [Moraxella osloensis]OBX60583.1 antitoxin VapB11 [Moraxella osloensis]